MIIGVTHDRDGRVVQRLSVSTKVSIGLPPNGDRNHPTKLDHFVFLRKKKSANRVEWEADPELTRLADFFLRRKTKWSSLVGWLRSPLGGSPMETLVDRKSVV